jgi:hypothetical protein
MREIQRNVYQKRLCSSLAPMGGNILFQDKKIGRTAGLCFLMCPFFAAPKNNGASWGEINGR